MAGSQARLCVPFCAPICARAPAPGGAAKPRAARRERLSGPRGRAASPASLFLKVPAVGVYLCGVGLQCAFMWAGLGLGMAPFPTELGKKANWLWDRSSELGGERHGQPLFSQCGRKPWALEGGPICWEPSAVLPLSKEGLE